MTAITEAKRFVFKVGTSTLTYSTGRINVRRFETLCKVLADIKNSGREVILVSSGAVSVGLAKLGMFKRPNDIPGKQAAAAVGQCELMYLYDRVFMERSHKVAQVLLTRDAFEQPDRRRNTKNTFDRLLLYGALPIVNENDTVAVDELEVGDNDTLSAMVAVLTEADALILLSDIDGLYESDPNKDPNAKLIPVVERIDESIEGMAGASASDQGTGGMSTKIHAAKIATENGIAMAIINGEEPEKIYDLLDGKPVGSLFLPQTKKSSL